MITRAIELIVVESSTNPNGAGALMHTEWTWTERDPFVVTVHFEEDVVWEISRETVCEGVDAESGIGDVRIWRSGGEHCRIRLCNDEGLAVMECERKPLKDFSLRVSRMVPKQHEISDADIERYLTQWSAL